MRYCMRYCMRQGVGIRQATGVVVTMFVLAALLPVVTPGGAQAQSGQSFVIQPYATVNVSQLPPAHLDPNPPVFFQRERQLHPDPARLQEEKAAANAGAAQDAAAPDVAAPDLTPGPLSVNLLTNFIGLRLSESGGFIPPDNGTAVGPNHVFEAVNVKGRIFDKATGATISTINLNTFFNVPGVALTDPVMRFDPTTSRWFVGIVTFENNGRWLLAVSKTSDPTGGFVLYQFTTVNSFPDFPPSIGISDDKVVLTANAFLGTNFQGAEFIVFNKANLVAGVAAASNFFAPDNTAFAIRAAQNLSSDNTIYMTMYQGFGTTLRVYRVTGVPPGASFTTVNRTIMSIANPPDAVQSGGAPLIQTNDNRLLDAAFRGSSLFTTGTSGCIPSGDVSTRACLRVIEILNPATTTTVNQDFNFGLSGIYMYFPALSITSTGDVISVFSRSSASEFAGVWASGRLSSDILYTYRPPALIKPGEAHYNPSSSRWGDFSSVAIDPSDQTKAWVSGEYARVEGGSEWGTWIAQVQLARAPSAANLLPGFPADYDGDRRTDIAVYRPSPGVWFIINSSTGGVTAQQWGAPGDDIPIPGDYDGDGKTDIAVYRPSTGVWFIIQSSNGAVRAVQGGGASGDVPMPGDYDGDGKTNIALYRPSTGVWFITKTITGVVRSQQWGAPGDDIPVPGDYDGDQRTDIAVYRASTGVWYIINSSTGGVTAQQWGAAGDIPVPGDYDGDGKTDIAVYRPSTGTV
jgi:hypothetical protein